MFINNFVKNILGVVGLRRRTKEEKINRARKKYGGDTLNFAMEVFEAEELDQIKDNDEWFHRLVALAEQHRLNWPIEVRAGNDSCLILTRIQYLSRCIDLLIYAIEGVKRG